ncbi:MAG: biosynthetic-type acetolactate synthase large subunit [Bilophila sp.]
MLYTGARILLECLKREGVDLFFGYPGGQVIDIYNELSSHPDLRHVLVRHEQGAVHAADGYARASGKVGVCLATSGPGATNTVTGIATAYSDSIPMVILTGQVHTALIGNDAFQEVDIVGITRPCTKHNYLVKDVRSLAHIIRQAFYLARSGRPGPVLVDIPKDVQQATCDFVWPEDVAMSNYCPTFNANLNQLRRAMDVLVTSRRPLLLAGGGVIMANAADEVRTIAHLLHMPVTATLMGLGAFPGDDPLWSGMLGMHGCYAANNAVSQADVILAVGVRFDDRVTGKLSTFAPHARIVHIDIDPTTLRKNVRVEVPVVSDCLSALQGLRAIVESGHAQKDWEGDHADWLQQIKDWQTQQPLAWTKGEHLKPQQVVEALDRITEGNAIITTEVGQNQMWAAQFYTYRKPRTFLTSGGLGTMGYGLPAAIGAQMAFPDKLVVDVAGDGSIQMNSQELMTAVENKLPVKILILNNQYLGMVRQWQELFYNTNYVATDMTGQPDFVKLAEAYGAEGYRITTEAELAEILPKALASPHTAVIDVRVERGENVYPIVPAGAALDEMLVV